MIGYWRSLPFCTFPSVVYLAEPVNLCLISIHLEHKVTCISRRELKRSSESGAIAGWVWLTRLKSYFVGGGLGMWKQGSRVRNINVFVSHSFRLLLDWNPNKIGSLQCTEEDKFGFLSSFHLFDAFLTKRDEKYRKLGRLQFLWNVLMLIWHF